MSILPKPKIEEKGRISRLSIDSKVGSYRINFKTKIKSVCIDDCWFTNFVCCEDVNLCNHVKGLLKLNGELVPLNEMPLALDDYHISNLYNYKTNIVKEKRYKRVLSAYGVNVEKDVNKSDLKKYKLKNIDGSVRDSQVRIITTTDSGTFDIYLVDAYHMFASEVTELNFKLRKGFSNMCISELE